MKRGKATCKILKEIRQEIAHKNDIPLEMRECTYEGDCRGTCPRCEAEVRYLENELQKKSQLGKAVITTGIMLGGMLMSGCHSSTPTSPEETTPTSSETILNHNEPTEAPDTIPIGGETLDFDDEGIIETEVVIGQVIKEPSTPQLPENDSVVSDTL